MRSHMTATRQTASDFHICWWSRRGGATQNAFKLTLPEPARRSSGIDDLTESFKVQGNAGKQVQLEQAYVEC